MLKTADEGILFRPPQNVIDEFDFPFANHYARLRELVSKALDLQ